MIPLLHTNATILPMGVTEDGSMQVPDSITDVGWYKLGARPGQTGTAVIAGHVDGKNGEDGVFAQLKSLKPGAAIGVEDAFGNIGAFIVKDSKTYDQSVDTSKIFASQDGTHLNLITCEGAWDQTKQTYTKRLVVFADLMR
jgi:LPXTG-site transpeptidase (sortase) family protein